MEQFGSDIYSPCVKAVAAPIAVAEKAINLGGQRDAAGVQSQVSARSQIPAANGEMLCLSQRRNQLENTKVSWWRVSLNAGSISSLRQALHFPM